MKKAVSLITSLSLLGSVFVLSSCSLFGVPIDERHFPDNALRGAVRSYVDKDENGYLSKEELENAEALGIWGPCSDLSGIEYLTNLKRLSIVEFQGPDLSGVEKLTNLEEIYLSDIYGQFPDLSALDDLTNLKELNISEAVFSETFVFDNEISVPKVNIKYCVFEKGILFNNDSVEDVYFDGCAAIGDVVFADCDGLIGFHAEFMPDDDGMDCLEGYDYEYFEALKEENYSIDLSGCDNLEYFHVDNREAITSVDLSNCSMLSSLYLFDWRDEADEITLNICGCPNIEYAFLGTESIKELDISDCPYLLSASEQTPSDKDYALEYESEDGYLYSGNKELVLIK